MKMTLAEIARVVDAELLAPNKDAVVTSVAFDTRQIKAGGLFVPLVGERDGHEFIDAAEKMGPWQHLWPVTTKSIRVWRSWLLTHHSLRCRPWRSSTY